MTDIVKATELAGSMAASDLSVLALISNADIIVKFVMLILFASSVWSWAIIIDKFIKLKAITTKLEKFERIFWSGQLLDQLYERIKSRADHPMAFVFVAAMNEWGKQTISKAQITNSAVYNGIKERIRSAMDLARNKELDKIGSNLSFLASIGSYSPFVGLFGTVWGIMNSFKSIAATKNTTLAVVAPGIAEALLATAIGLLAAIPAYVFYNILANKVSDLNNRVDDFSSELSNLLSREIDREIING